MSTNAQRLRGCKPWHARICGGAISSPQEVNIYFEGIRAPSFAVDPVAQISVVRRGRIPDRARYRSGGVYLQDAVDAIPGRLGITGSVRVSGAWYQALVGRQPDCRRQTALARRFHDRLGYDLPRQERSYAEGRGQHFRQCQPRFPAPNMTDLGTYGLTGSGYEVAAPDIAGLGGTVGSTAGSNAVSTGVPVEQLRPESSMSYELGLRFWNRRIDADVTLFTSRIHSTIEKQALILPPGAEGTNLAGQPVIAQGPTGVVYVPAAANPVLVRANYGEAQVYGIEQTLDWRIRDDLVLGTILTCLRARNTRTGLPPDIEGGTPAPDGYLKLRYQIRNGRFWLEPFVHAAARQERLSSLDLEDRRTGAMRSRASIRRFFYNGATARRLVGPGADGKLGSADDLLLPTGETLAQVQGRVLGRRSRIRTALSLPFRDISHSICGRESVSARTRIACLPHKYRRQELPGDKLGTRRRRSEPVNQLSHQVLRAS